MKILIAADTVIRENNIEAFNKREKILENGLEEIWKQADYRILNLEAPITDSQNKIKKCGPNLKSSIKAENIIQYLNPSLVLLANNHIMDYGENGLKDTIRVLEKHDINYIGIGENCYNSIKSYSLNCDGKSIAFYNCCETEFSVAEPNKAGANGFDILYSFDDIEKLKKENDIVIVFYHGGKEHYRYPSPNLQRICHRMVDVGADFIICQHSHCIGCNEKYNEKSIIYGQGNFIFNKYNNEFWNTSLIVEIDTENGLELHYIPITSTTNGTGLANEEEGKEILYSFETRSKQIMEDGFIINNYNDFAKKQVNSYLERCHGSNKMYKFLNKLLHHKLAEKLYSEQNLISILNMVECEAHRELFIKGLKDKIK